MSYKLQGKMDFQGLSISIENRKGSLRRWKDEYTGEEGVTKMVYPYGYVSGTLGTDGDEVDVFVGPNKSSERVFVITQNAKPFGKLDNHPWIETDEQKVMLGFDSSQEAQEAYLMHYNDHRFFGKMIELTLDDFKERLVSHKGTLIKGSNPKYDRKSKKVEKSLNSVLQAAIINGRNMLVLSKSDSNKTFTPSHTDSTAEESSMDKARSSAIEVLRKAKLALDESKMDLKKKKAAPDKAEEDLSEEDTEKGFDVSKALRAITVSGLSKRAKMDAAFQLGQTAGKYNRVFKTAPAAPTNISLNLGTSKAQPAHEPPVVHVRHMDTPGQEVRGVNTHKSCTVHGYVHKSDIACPLCKASQISEAKPLWNR